MQLVIVFNFPVWVLPPLAGGRQMEGEIKRDYPNRIVPLRMGFQTPTSNLCATSKKVL